MVSERRHPALPALIVAAALVLVGGATVMIGLWLDPTWRLTTVQDYEAFIDRSLPVNTSKHAVEDWARSHRYYVQSSKTENRLRVSTVANPNWSESGGLVTMVFFFDEEDSLIRWIVTKDPWSL
jgi:hypothetical protein